MSKTQLQTNNTRLASLIDTLKGKAAGGGGASIETCTVTINYEVWQGPGVGTYCATAVENGQLVTVSSEYNEPFTCAQGTLVVLTKNDVLINEIVVSGCECISSHFHEGNVFAIPHGSKTATITIM